MPRLSLANRYRLLAVLDSAIALLVVFPLTCMYFRGIWDLIGHYVLPDRPPLQYWVYVVIGQLQIIGLIVLPYLDRHLDRSKKAKFWILSRLFMYIYTVPYMFYWHGLWLIMNHYMGTDWQYSSVTFFFAWMILSLMGSCRSTMWPPFFIAVDTQPDSLTLCSRFKTKPSKMRDYVSDAYLSQLVILGLAICCWRSLFNVIDGLLYPEDGLMADIVSAEIGVVGCTVMLSLQWPLGKVSAKLAKAEQYGLKLIWENFVYAITFVVLAMLWRGVWNLNVRYFIAEYPLGPWVNFILGSVGLLGIQTFTEVCNFGITDDGLDPAGEAFYPVHYLRIFFKKYYEPPSGRKSMPDIEKKKREYDDFTLATVYENGSTKFESTKF